MLPNSERTKVGRAVRDALGPGPLSVAIAVRPTTDGDQVPFDRWPTGKAGRFLHEGFAR